MGLVRAAVVTPWYSELVTDPETGETHTATQYGGAYCPAVMVKYSLKSCQDVTSQRAENLIPEPNALTVEVVCEDTVLEQIEGDGYPVLWSEVI